MSVNDDLMEVFAIEERLTTVEGTVVQLTELVTSITTSGIQMNANLQTLADLIDVVIARIDLMRADIDLIYKKGTW